MNGGSSCAVCKRHIALTRAGVIRQHGFARARCSGSGLPPLRYILSRPGTVSAGDSNQLPVSSVPPASIANDSHSGGTQSRGLDDCDGAAGVDASSAYACPSLLFCGDHTLLSAEGVQQGDPLGPLLFCITIQPLIQRLHSDFSVFYLDDGTIGGSRDDVLADLQLDNEAATLGLKLNRSKTELVSSDVGAQNSILSIVSELKVVPCSQVSLLGTPIGSLELLDSTIQAKTKKLQLMGMRLSGLRSQDALCLLRHSFAIPKVLFILLSAPSFLSNNLEAFDGLLRSLLSSILNINLDHDASWL